MKLLKAFIRTTKAEDVVGALRRAGAPGITISRVVGVGYGYEPLTFTLARGEIDDAEYLKRRELLGK